jgi:hypothetical protein
MAGRVTQQVLIIGYTVSSVDARTTALALEVVRSLTTVSAGGNQSQTTIVASSN